jgi:alpha-glucosidase/alpha-D-xyloside xylohydrolase
MAIFAVVFLAGTGTFAQTKGFILDRGTRTVAVEPYGPNIIRITLSTEKSAALAAPGYGFVGTPSENGWSHEKDFEKYDVIRSGRMIVRVSPENLSPPHRMPLDALNESLLKKFFGGGFGGNNAYNDAISITTASSRPLLTMRNWTMIPNRPEDTSKNAESGQKADPGYRVSAIFDSPDGEHYYGLGQHQQGFLDLRDHHFDCWHEYNALGGETVGVPFMVSSRNYGLIWDNPSKTTVDLGFNLQNVWSSAVGDRVSFFVIAGDTSDEIYKAIASSPGSHICCRKLFMAIFRARQSIPPRTSSWLLRRDIATASCRSMCWWWTS